MRITIGRFSWATLSLATILLAATSAHANPLDRPDVKPWLDSGKHSPEEIERNATHDFARCLLVEKRNPNAMLDCATQVLDAAGVPRKQANASAKAATWWILDSRSGSCVPSSHAVDATRDPAFASPFTLAEEMRLQGRLERPIDQKRTASGSAYAVFHDGVTTAYFTAKGGCEEFLSFARGHGDLP
jgi:hypothetical protein